MKEIRRILVKGIDDVEVETIPAPEAAAGEVEALVGRLRAERG